MCINASEIAVIKFAMQKIYSPEQRYTSLYPPHAVGFIALFIASPWNPSPKTMMDSKE